jgi:hypothetical protein
MIRVREEKGEYSMINITWFGQDVTDSCLFLLFSRSRIWTKYVYIYIPIFVVLFVYIYPSTYIRSFILFDSYGLWGGQQQTYTYIYVYR